MNNFPTHTRDHFADPVHGARAAAGEEARLNECRAGAPVHLMDIHMEKGMHCIDCHFIQDVHGNTKLQGEVRAGIEIQCIDCHGSTTRRADLRTTGPAAYTSSPQGGRDLEATDRSSSPRHGLRRADPLGAREVNSPPT